LSLQDGFKDNERAECELNKCLEESIFLYDVTSRIFNEA